MRRRSHRASQIGPRHARGELLLGALFAIGLLLVALLLYMRMENRRQQIRLADQEGQALAQFALGLRGFAAAVQADLTLLPAADHGGVDWLKPPACGGLATNPAEGYVPCSFTGETFGSLYSTSFQLDPVSRALEFRTSFVVPPIGGNMAAGATNASSMLIAERMAGAAVAGQANPSAGLFFNAFANVPADANAPHSLTTGEPGVDSGRVVLVVNNAPSNDIYLRTDGTNQMMADLNMGGQSITNAANGRFSGDVRADGQMQVTGGLTVTDGPADFRQGVVADELYLSSLGRYVSQAVYDAEVFTGALSYTIPKQDCSKNGGSPGIYAVLQSTGAPTDTGASGDALYSARVDVTDLGASWQVTPVLQTMELGMWREGTDIVLGRTVKNVAASGQRVLVMRRCR